MTSHWLVVSDFIRKLGITCNKNASIFLCKFKTIHSTRKPIELNRSYKQLVDSTSVVFFNLKEFGFQSLEHVLKKSTRECFLEKSLIQMFELLIYT